MVNTRFILCLIYIILSEIEDSTATGTLYYIFLVIFDIIIRMSWCQFINHFFILLSFDGYFFFNASITKNVLQLMDVVCL